MKKLLLLILSAVIFSSCGQKADNSAENEATINAYVEAVQSLDYNSMDNFLADDYMGYGPSVNDSIGKADAVKAWRQNVDNLYESIEYKRSRSIAVSVPDGDAKGEWVSNWASLDITYKGSGEKITIMTNSIYLLENGKIKRSYTFYNEADALEQLGYYFINPDKL